MPRLSRGTIRKTVKGSLVRDAGVESPSAARVLTLVLPMPENIANARMHWRVKHKAKKDYFEMCDDRQRVGLIVAPPRLKIGRADVRSVMYLGSHMDADNAMARHKWPLDWLQSRGYIVNDKHLTWTTLPAQFVKRDGKYRIELTITETDQ